MPFSATSKSPRSRDGISVCQSFCTNSAARPRRRARAPAISTSKPLSPEGLPGSWKTYGSPPCMSPPQRRVPRARMAATRSSTCGRVQPQIRARKISAGTVRFVTLRLAKGSRAGKDFRPRRDGSVHSCYVAAHAKALDRPRPSPGRRARRPTRAGRRRDRRLRAVRGPARGPRRPHLAPPRRPLPLPASEGPHRPRPLPSRAQPPRELGEAVPGTAPGRRRLRPRRGARAARRVREGGGRLRAGGGRRLTARRPGADGARARRQLCRSRRPARGRARRRRDARRSPQEARRVGTAGRALDRHALRNTGAGRGGASRARRRRRRRPQPDHRAGRHPDRGARPALPRPEARRQPQPPGPHPAPRRPLRRGRSRLRRAARAPARLRGGRVRPAGRPRPRDVPQGRHLGRRPREARGAGPLRGLRRLQDVRAGALPLMLAALLLALLALPARADDLVGEAVSADAAIEERVRLVLAHRLEGSFDVLAADVTALAALDEEREAKGLPPTGLTDDVRYVAAGLAATRDAQREALRALLDAHPDPVVRKCAERRLEADEAARADQLLADDRHNRRAGVVNDFVRPLGVFSGGVLLAALNPFLLAGSAIDSVATTAANLWHYGRLSRQEREALVHYRTLLEREPRTSDAPEIARAIRRPGSTSAAASRFIERHEGRRFASSARYALAIGRDLAGHHEAARDALADVARDHRSSVGRHVANLLASPDFDRLAAIDEAERRHRRETLRYVFLGGRLDGRTAVYSAAQLGATGVQAAESIGMFNVIGVLTRGWQAWRHDPVSNQGIIDPGEGLLAREPNSPEAANVHARLAGAYQPAGNYGRALMHYQATPGPNPKRVAALEDKLADRMLEDAGRTGPGDRTLLEAIVRHLGETKAADKARKRLRDLPGTGETVLARDVLEANPSLLGPEGLDLDPRLLDGDHTNGELADAGVTLAAGEMRLTLYNSPGPGQHVETRPVSSEVFARARAAAEEALYARLLTADRRDADTGRYERYIPFFVQGSLGDDGVAVYPGVKMRRDRSEDRDLYE